MVKRLATLKVDYRGRGQLPVELRSYLNLPKQKESEISVWVIEEKVVLERIGTGTPNPFTVKPGYRSVS